MMHAVLADTGPLYAAVDPRDEFHEQAVAEMRKLAHDGRRVVVAMADTALINPTPEDYRQAIARVGAVADQPVTLFDATVAVLATRLRLEVWTYDHHFDMMRVGVWR